MRILCCLLLALALAASAETASSAPRRGLTVLFVGNSLTYVGNTPAVFDALAAANAATVSSDMIVKGGATLAQRASDGSVARALAAKRYDAVVLQERGGDLMCSFGPDSCTESRKAIGALVALAGKAGARTYLLGTYQGHPGASKALVAAESAAAAEAGIEYLEVSEKLQRLRTAAPGMAWQAPDGVHPGPALALLNAVVLHQALLGRLPAPAPFVVNAPIYGSTSGLTEAVRRAEDPPPLADTPGNLAYPAEWVKIVLRSLDDGTGD